MRYLTFTQVPYVFLIDVFKSYLDKKQIKIFGLIQIATAPALSTHKEMHSEMIIITISNLSNYDQLNRKCLFVL